MELLEMLHSPSREFTPIPFWFLNGDLTDAEIRGQLADFAAHGVYGVVLHPRMGLPRRIGYLSETFFHYICTAVQAAAELDMKVVLYDEGMYPSGSAGGQVVAEHPELASEGITQTRELLPGDEVLCKIGDGRDQDGEARYLVARKSGGTMRGLHWGEDDGEPEAPLTADILNPLAVDRFIELTHEAYYQKLKAYFGTTVIGFFTDEPSILGRNVREAPSISSNAVHLDGAVEALFAPLRSALNDRPLDDQRPRSARRQNAPSIERNASHLDGAVGMLPWTHGFAEEFEAAGGSLEGLTALFLGIENDDTRLYHRLILQRECDVYYGKLSAWCEAHGIALMGHPHQSDDIEVQRYFHVPGQDLVGRRLGPEKSGIESLDSTMAKCSADAARLLGRRRNSNECFGDCNKDGNPWNLSGGDLKWYLDWLAVRGVNLFIPHAFYYSVEGRRSGERPPDVGRNNIWWPHYHLWSDYMRRLSALMTDAELIAPVAVLCRNRALCPETVAPLYERQIGFQYIPESVWKDIHEESSLSEKNALRSAPVGAKRTSTGRSAPHLDGAVEKGEKELVLYDRNYTVVLGDEQNQFSGVPHEIRYTDRLGFPSEKNGSRLSGARKGKSVKKEALVAADLIADCICDPPAPNLRCAHFLRMGVEKPNAAHLDGAVETLFAPLRSALNDRPLDDQRPRFARRQDAPSIERNALHLDGAVECWFLVNEGNAPIDTKIELCCANGERPQYVGQYDLWSDRAGGFSDSAVEAPPRCTRRQNAPSIEKNAAHLDGAVAKSQWLHLDNRESLLLFACTAEDYQELQRKHPSHCVRRLSCPKLTCVRDEPDRVRKVYEGTLNIERNAAHVDSALEDTVGSKNKLHEQLILPIEAEEMVELTVNGIEAGVSFWSPHDFDVTDLVHEGENEICLVVTGSLANRYGRPVWYGLKGDGYDR